MHPAILHSRSSFVAAAFLLLCAVFPFAQQPENSPSPAVTLRGKVRDARTGEGIAKALVLIREQSQQTVTDAGGAFVLPNLRPGEAELYVSTVGYEFLKQKVLIPADRDLETDILLGQQASKPHETVRVVADPLDPLQLSVVSSNALDNSELKNLATVIVDDPLRSVQTLPGVATSDDYNAQFSLRGMGFTNLGVYVDGVLLSSPFHTAQDIQQTGSVTLFNSDVVDSIELISSGFPARFGESLGSILDVKTREGSQKQIFTRADFGMAGLAATSEGPLGPAHKSSWLVSGRKSYIGTLLHEWGANYLAVGYSDLQGKLSFHPNDHHRLTITPMLGSGWVEPSVDSYRYSHIRKGQTTTQTIDQGWDWTLSPSVLLHSQLSYVHQKAWNHDQQNNVPFRSYSHSGSAQQELDLQLPPGHVLAGGWMFRRGQEKLDNDYYDLQYTNFRIYAHYDAPAWWTSGFLQDSWELIPRRLQLNLGGRAESFSPTEQTLWMPRASMALHLTADDKVTLAWGRYAQFPTFRQLYGEVYNTSLRAERATHYVVGFEHRLNERTRIRVEAYDIRLHEGIYSPDQEWRLPRPIDLEHGLIPIDGALTPRLGPYLRNSLSGHSRGLEFELQRRSANRLSGWVSYAYGLASFSDPADELTFWGDYDQRHTVNAYGSYRFTKTINLSGKYRFGTNFPLPGFYASDGKNLFFVQERNRIRLNDYSRLDLRLSKAIYAQRRKFTLYSEVGNVLNRSNRGCQVHAIIQAIPSCDSEFPILPSAGMTLEF